LMVWWSSCLNSNSEALWTGGGDGSAFAADEHG